jgi:hypothetical protein
MFRDNKKLVAIVEKPVGDRRCDRCGGNVFIDKDADGWFTYCLQCSNRRDLRSVVNG